MFKQTLKPFRNHLNLASDCFRLWMLFTVSEWCSRLVELAHWKHFPPHLLLKMLHGCHTRGQRVSWVLFTCVRGKSPDQKSSYPEVVAMHMPFVKGHSGSQVPKQNMWRQHWVGLCAQAMNTYLLRVQWLFTPWSTSHPTNMPVSDPVSSSSYHASTHRCKKSCLVHKTAM